MRCLLLLSPLVLSSACNLGNDDFHVRLVPVGPMDLANSLTDATSIGDAVLGVFNHRLLKATDAGLVDVRGANGLVPFRGAVFVADIDGVSATTDGATFTVASTEVFADLGALGDSLYGVRIVEGTEFAVFRSVDDGVTFTEVFPHFSVSANQEMGVGFIGTTTDVLLAQGSANAATNGNFAPVFQTVTVREGLVTPIDVKGIGIELPLFVAADGTAVARIEGRPDADPDELHVGWKRGWALGDAADTFAPVYATVVPVVAGFPTDNRLVGVDADGHLLVVVGTTLMRTEKPFAGDQNQRDELMKGPGCQGLHDRERENGDGVAVTIKNESALTVVLRTADGFDRLFSRGDFAPGATLDTQMQSTGYVIASDPATGVCLSVVDVPDDGGTVIIR
jgi:hypothetical protein